jgi:hypothetical protein
VQNYQFGEAATEIPAAMVIAWENEFHADHDQLVEQLAQIPALQAAHAAQQAEEAQLARQQAATVIGTGLFIFGSAFGNK